MRIYRLKSCILVLYVALLLRDGRVVKAVGPFRTRGNAINYCVGAKPAVDRLPCTVMPLESVWKPRA